VDIKYKKMIKRIKESNFLEISDDYSKTIEILSCDNKYTGKDTLRDCSPFLSIIVPTYKRPTLLKETLESIISQKGFIDYEIVVVDNEGIDHIEGASETEKVILEINNSRIRYYQNRKNVSSGENWNICLALARGEWICMVHDDDVLLPDCLRSLYVQIVNNPDIEFLGCINYSFQTKEELEHVKEVKKANIYGIGYEEFMYGMPVMLLGAFFKRSRAIELGGFDTISYMQDYVFVAKFAYFFNIYIYNRPLYGYRISMNQDSANNEMNFIRRVADYYLWKSIAQKRGGCFQKLYLKNCQYNLRNRIGEYNSNGQYGLSHHIDQDDIFLVCEINKNRLNNWEYYLCKGVHFINMIRKREVRSGV